MPTKKKQRQQVARQLKYTGLPLPIRGTLAKMLVRGDGSTDIQEFLAKAGCTVVRSYGDCSDPQCCSQYSHQVWNYNGNEFNTEYGSFQLRPLPPTPPPTPRQKKPKRKPISDVVLLKLEEMRKAHLSLVSQANVIEADIRQASTAAVRDHLGDSCPSWLEHSSWWICKTSPTGYCVYNHTEDPIHDHCLFCGDPEERK